MKFQIKIPMDESSPLLPAASTTESSTTKNATIFRRHESLPSGPFELTKSGSENARVKLRKIGTFTSHLSDSNGNYDSELHNFLY